MLSFIEVHVNLIHTKDENVKLEASINPDSVPDLNN